MAAGRRWPSLAPLTSGVALALVAVRLLSVASISASFWVSMSCSALASMSVGAIALKGKVCKHCASVPGYGRWQYQIGNIKFNFILAMSKSKCLTEASEFRPCFVIVGIRAPQREAEAEIQCRKRKRTAGNLALCSVFDRDYTILEQGLSSWYRGRHGDLPTPVTCKT